MPLGDLYSKLQYFGIMLVATLIVQKRPENVVHKNHSFSACMS